MTPGLHDNIDEQVYHSDRGSLSVSGAKVLLKSPAKFRWQRDHPVFKDVFDFGSAAHKLVLGVGPTLVVHEYDAEKVKSPKATTAWKAQQAEVREAGDVLLLPDEMATVTAMADKLSENATAMRLLSDGRAEVSAYALDEESGVTMRCRFDWLAQGHATDYKTAVTSDPSEFGTVAARYGYHQQAAYYLDVAAVLGLDLAAFAFIVQMKEPPYLVSVCELDADSIDLGRRLNRRALGIFAECVASGHWRDWANAKPYSTVRLPAWAFREEEIA